MKLFYTAVKTFALLCLCFVSHAQKTADNIRLRTVRAGLLALSPDDKEIASAHMFGGLKFFDVASGRQIREIEGSFIDTGNNEITKLAYSRTGKQFFVFRDHSNGGTELAIYDLATGAVVRKFKGMGKGVMSVSPSEKYILIETSAKVLEVFDFQMGTKIKTFRNNAQIGEMAGALITPDDKSIVTYSKSGVVSFMNLFTEKEEQIVTIPKHRSGRDLEDRNILTFEFSPSGKYFATYDNNNNEIIIWDSADREIINSLKYGDGGAIDYIPGTSTIAWSKDEKSIVCIVKEEGFRDASIITKVDITSRSGIGSTKLPLMISEFSEWDISSLVVGGSGKVYFTNRNVDLNIWATDFTNAPAKVIKSPMNDFTIHAGTFSATEKELFHANAGGEIFQWDLFRGIYKGRFKKVNLNIHSLRCSADNAKLIVTGEENFLTDDSKVVMYVFDIASGTQLSKEVLTNYNEHQGLQINNIKSGDGFYCWTINEGPLYINDKKNKTLILASMRESDKDYVVVAGDGRFDGTEKAIKELLFAVENNKITGIESYRPTFYTPNLLRNFFFPGRQAEMINPPSVSIAAIPAQPGRYTVTAVNKKQGIGRIEVYINDKLVHEDARKLVSPNPASLADRPSVNFTLDMSKEQQALPGKVNVIGVVAYEKTNGIASEMETMEVNSSSSSNTTVNGPVEMKAPAAPRESQAPKFWAIVVGVSDYANPQLNLRYSAKDAKAMATALRIAGRNLFTAANTTVLELTSESVFNQLPTRANVQKAIDQVKAKAGYDDVLLVYMAGHGISHKGEQEDFYFLTSDARTSDYQSPETRRSQSISGKEIMEFLNTTKAQKQLLIMDACAAGTLANNLIAGRDLSEAVRRGIERMRDRTATYILAANAPDRKSYETSEYGQGILTHTLLQGMKGAALREGKYVDVSDLLQYARDQVELRAREIDLLQVPMVVTPKNNESFDIGLLISNADKAKIPANDPKPVFTKTNFLQAGEFDDTKELSQLVDDRLFELSYQGASPPIAFVQANYPNAYHLAGEYKIAHNVVTLQAKLFQNKIAKGNIKFTGNARDLAEAVLLQVTAILNKK